MSVPAELPPPKPSAERASFAIAPTRSGAETGHRIAVSSTDAVIAAVPHMLGFPPKNSLVLVGLVSDESGRSHAVRMTQRVDLPPADAGLGELTGYTQDVVEPMARTGATAVVAVIHGASTPGTSRPLPHTALADQLALELSEHDLWVRDLLYTDGTTHWSYGCQDAGCCPPEGRVVPEQVRTWVAAEFAATGAAMARSRDALAEEITPDPVWVETMAARLENIAPPVDVEAWRDRTITTVTGLGRHGLPDSATAALVLDGLRDFRVRDTALWDLAQPDVDQHAAIAGLRAVLRSAPPGHVAPVATVLALQHWQTGDGARANTCLDRALSDDPDYTLANLTQASLRRGMPPRAWGQMMDALGRDVCRRALEPPYPLLLPGAETVPTRPSAASLRAPALPASPPPTRPTPTGLDL